jgi:DNA integrity scanning protein DisA with diadenylate cyclase activity
MPIVAVETPLLMLIVLVHDEKSRPSVSGGFSLENMIASNRLQTPCEHRGERLRT